MTAGASLDAYPQYVRDGLANCAEEIDATLPVGAIGAIEDFLDDLLAYVNKLQDGAEGFGFHGEGRDISGHYAENEIDAQGARPLSMIGVAYVQNSMWAGRFGARFNNVGTEAVWNQDAATALNHLGLDGLEAQNIDGTITHRMRVNEYVLDTLGYRPMFDAAFYDWPANARYGREAMRFKRPGLHVLRGFSSASGTIMWFWAVALFQPLL